MNTLQILLAWSLLSASSTAASLLYTFSGVLPPGASDHPHILDGESFTGTFVVDRSLSVDQEPDDLMIGVFPSVVVSGSLVFSGGYVSPIEYSGADVFVANDATSEFIPPFDAILIRDRSDSVLLQAINSVDLENMLSDNLPGTGRSLLSALNSPRLASAVQLTYSDALGEVSYSGGVASNVIFTSSFVPESSSCSIAATLLTMVGGWGRIRQIQ